MDTTDLITTTVDRLRLAVVAARQASQTYRTASDLAECIEAALDVLRRDLERNAPIETRLAGTFYALGDPATVRFREGDRLTLRREPENRADSNAVAVLTEDGTRCGYLPRGVAANLAPALDSGLEAESVVTGASGTDISVEVSGPAVVALKTRTGIYEEMPW